MPTISLVNNLTSTPVAVGAGSVVTVTPTTGAVVSTEYTTGSLADIANGAAEWLPCPLVPAAANGSAADGALSGRVKEAVFVRATSRGGAASLLLDDSPAANTLRPMADWEGVKPLSNSSLGARVVLLGDSITWYGEDKANVSSRPSLARTSRSIMELANAMTGQRLNIVANAGVSGDRFDQMLARFNRDVAPHRPTLVILQGGSNNIDAGYSALQSWPAIMGIYRACRAIGAAVLFVGTAGMFRGAGAIPSPVDGVQYSPPAELAGLLTLGRKAQYELEGFMFCDMAAPTRDYGAAITPSQVAQGIVLTGMSADGTHPSPYGCYTQARRIADFLNNVFVGTSADRSTVNGYITGDLNAIAGGNYLMMGTAGTVSAPNTGAVSTPFTVSSTGSIQAVCSGIARSDGGPGRAERLVISGAAAVTDRLRIAASSPYTREIGLMAFVQAAVKVSAVTSGALFNAIGNLQFLGAGSALLAQVFFGRPHSTQSADGYTDSAGTTGLTGTVDFGVLRSPRMAVPAGTTTILISLDLYTSIGAQLTVDVAEFGGLLDVETAEVAKYRNAVW